MQRMKSWAGMGIGLAVLGASALAMHAADRGADVNPAATVAEAATYEVDPVHSAVLFRVKHAGTSNFWGRFNDLDGTFTFDPEDPESGSFEFTIDNASVDTGNENRDNHLRSPDFFNARQYPTTTFKSTKIEPAGEGRYTVTGDLELHGTTRPVTADLEWLGTGTFRDSEIAAFEATLDIKRTDFGMDTFVPPDGSDAGGVGNNVRIIIAVEGRKQE